MSYYRTVRLADTDAAGVVYFAAALSICHEAYEASLAEVGINFSDLLTGAAVLPVIHAHIDYFQPLYCGDLVEVRLATCLEKADQFLVSYEIFRAKEVSRSVIRAVTRHVCIDKASRQRIPLSEPLLSWLAKDVGG